MRGIAVTRTRVPHVHRRFFLENVIEVLRGAPRVVECILEAVVNFRQQIADPTVQESARAPRAVKIPS